MEYNDDDMNDDDSDHEIAVGDDFVMEHNSADVASLNSQFMFSYTIYWWPRDQVFGSLRWAGSGLNSVAIQNTVSLYVDLSSLFG